MRLFNLLKTALTKLGLINDYVVEQGTSGKFRYRKWNSGLIEMWSRQSISFSSFTSVNGMYRATKKITLPFAIPAANVISAHATGQYSGIFVVGNSDFSGGAGVLEVQALRGSGTTSVSGINTTIYVAGKM